MANDRYDNGQDNWGETPQNDNGGSGGNYYRPYGSNGGGFNNNGIFPNQPPQDPDGRTAKTLGLVGLFLTLCFCRIAGIVLGIIGYNKANRSVRSLGFETSDASTGRVLGIVNIVLGALMLIGSIVSIIFSGALTALIAGEGGESFNFFSTT